MSQAFVRAQIGKETNRGTPVAATKVLVNGVLTANPDVAVSRLEQDRNSLALYHTRTFTRRETALSWKGAATFNQLIDFLSMGVKGVITPTTPGGGTNSRTWRYLRRLNTANAPNAYTFEWGDNNQEFEASFVMCKALTLDFVMGQSLQLTADLFGQTEAKSTFTGSLTPANLEEILASKVKLYIDTTWAGLGGTVKATVLRHAKLTLPTGIEPYQTGDGNLYYSTYVERKTSMAVELAYIASAGAITEYDAWAADPPTARFIRLKVLGSTIEAALTNYLTVDMHVKWDDTPELFALDGGETLVVLKGHTYHDTTDASGGTGNAEGQDYALEVQNNVTAL